MPKPNSDVNIALLCLANSSAYTQITPKLHLLS